MMRQSPLPPGWREEYLMEADLDRSYERLAGCGHFHAESLRGRIRSLQLRTREASEHFERAIRMSEDEVESVPNLLYLILAQSLQLQNWLFESPLDREVELVSPRHPPLPESFLEEYPEIRAVSLLRKGTDGLLALHLGRSERAARRFGEIVAAGGAKLQSQVISAYFGLACCACNRGDPRSAAAWLENAEFAAHMVEWTLVKAQAASLLVEFYSLLEDRKRSEEWALFLRGLSCPRATQEALLKRSELLRIRSIEQGNLVLV